MLTSRKITTYADNIKDMSDTPSSDGVTAAILKAKLDGRTDAEIKNSINGIVDDLTAITDGTSGADNIGATPTKTATTVQGQLEELKADKVETNAPITGATKCKITYDAKGLVTSGADLTKTDLPAEALLSDNLIVAVTSNRTDKIVSEKALTDYAILIGAGDMLQSTYDTQGKHTDAFNAANHTYDHTISGLTSSTTKLAIDEVANLISAITTRVSTAETDIDTLQTTAWQNLGSISVSSNTLRLDINVPTGINEIRITGMLKVGTSSVTTCQFNDDATSNYYHAQGNMGTTYSGQNNTTTALVIQPISTTETNIDMHFFHLNDTNLYKKVESFTSSNLGAGGNVCLGLKAFTNIVTKITLINSNNIVSGTNLRVWGR